MIDPMTAAVVQFGSDSEASAYAIAQERIKADGFFVARGLLNMETLADVRAYIGKLISTLRVKHGLSRSEERRDDLFDAGFQELCALDRAHGGVIYRACRRLHPVHALSCDKALVSLSQALMGTDFIANCNLKAVRIDHPDEDKYLFDLHQDYPYIQDSLNALVYWIPLRDVRVEDGALRVFPTSHLAGLQKIRILDRDNANKNGAHTIELADPGLDAKFPSQVVPLDYGDCLVFSTLLLHQSTTNRGGRHRWTMQIRHGDYSCQDSIDRDWPGGMIEGNAFDTFHPEYVVS